MSIERELIRRHPENHEHRQAQAARWIRDASNALSLANEDPSINDHIRSTNNAYRQVLQLMARLVG